MTFYQKKLFPTLDFVLVALKVKITSEFVVVGSMPVEETICRLGGHKCCIIL